MDEDEYELYSGVRFSVKYDFDDDYIKISIQYERLIHDKKIYFDLRTDKNLFWFFNFFMRLCFHPKPSVENVKKSILLLDNPGIYLDVHNQRELCKTLGRNIAKENDIIYCTHSPNLLDPTYIDLSCTQVCTRRYGSFELIPIFDCLNQYESYRCDIVADAFIEWWYYTLSVIKTLKDIDFEGITGVEKIELFAKIMEFKVNSKLSGDVLFLMDDFNEDDSIEDRRKKIYKMSKNLSNSITSGLTH
jgi:hypothetical protein